MTASPQMTPPPRATLALLLGNRDFFPDALVIDARRHLLARLDAIGVDVITVDLADSALGSVEGWRGAQLAGQLLARNRSTIDGILISLPNFGEEKALSDAVRLGGLDVPVLLHAFADDPGNLGLSARRDSFCGKISVANNLTQMGIPFSLTRRHVLDVDSAEFDAEILDFIAVCRVVKKLRGARIGVLGTRPDAFRTVRFSERILERAGISVSVMDLSDAYVRLRQLDDGDSEVAHKYGQLAGYADVTEVPDESMLRIAKLATVLDGWITDHRLDGVAIQCWSSLQKNLGVNACSAMSMLSEHMVPAACEADATGLVTMLALQSASGTPSALVDWNNNYGDDEDKCVFFHCGNWARSFVPTMAQGPSELLGTSLGLENTYGALAGRASSGPITFGRVTTDDFQGEIRMFVGEGELTDDPADTFGTYGVVRIPQLQKLLRYICREGFEHHAAMTQGKVARIVHEATKSYLGWSTELHPDGLGMRATRSAH